MQVQYIRYNKIRFLFYFTDINYLLNKKYYDEYIFDPKKRYVIKNELNLLNWKLYEKKKTKKT